MPLQRLIERSISEEDTLDGSLVDEPVCLGGLSIGMVEKGSESG